MPSLTNIRNKAAVSREILDQIWKEWVEHGTWPEAKVIHHGIPRSKVRQLLLPLNRAYVMEEQAGMGSIYKLGVIGALCTSGGDHFFDLALKFLEHCRDLFRINPRHTKVTSEDVAKTLKLSKEDNALLGRILSGELMAWTLKINGGGQRDYSAWEYSLPQDIDQVAETKDLRSLLEQRIADTDKPGESVFLDERLATIVRPISFDPANEVEFNSPTLVPTRMSSRRYQVFVSSTYEDLKRERQAVMLALLESKCIPAGMELFPAASVKQWELIKRVIDESDYYLVLVGGRYGSIPTGSGKKTSYTEREFNYAAKKKKPLLCFYHANPSKLSAKRREKTAIGLKRLNQFRAKIKGLPCGDWNSPTDLSSAVKTAVAYAIEHHPQPGWVRGGPTSGQGGITPTKEEKPPLDPILRLKVPMRAQAKTMLELMWSSEDQRIANSRLPELLKLQPEKAHLLRDKLYGLGLANNAANFERPEDFWIVFTDKGWDYVIEKNIPQGIPVIDKYGLFWNERKEPVCKRCILPLPFFDDRSFRCGNCGTDCAPNQDGKALSVQNVLKLYGGHIGS